INLILNEEVTGFIGDHYVEKVQTNKNLYKTEVVLLGIGVQPNTEFLTHTDIHLNDNGDVIVNAYQETNIKNVYAAGDCATDYHRVKQINDYIPHDTTANKQGRIAGANMENDSLTFKGIVGTSIIKDVDAAGDCAKDRRRVKQINDYILLGTTANKQGRIAGAKMAND